MGYGRLLRKNEREIDKMALIFSYQKKKISSFVLVLISYKKKFYKIRIDKIILKIYYVTIIIMNFKYKEEFS